jgi:PAS domain S-box-containing protein
MPDHTAAAAPAALSRRLALVGGAAVAAVGTLVLLVGWRLGVARLTDLIDGAAPMTPNTALALVLEGLGLACLTSMRAVVQRIGQSLGLAGAAIGAATGFQYLLGTDLGIDRVLANVPDMAQFGGRMPPLTAASILAVGLALYAVRLPPVWMSHLPALLVAMTSFVALIGYGYGTATLYSFGRYGTIAAHAAAAFIVLGIGVIAVRDHDGITGVLRSPGPGGELSRRFLPMAILLPALLGWLRLRGQEAGLYDTAFGVALFAVTLTVILLIVTVRSAAWIDRVDLQRQHMLRDLDSARRDALEREINLAAVVDSSDDAIVGCSVNGIIRTWNSGAERLYGYSAEDAIGQSVRMLVPPELQAELQGMMEACLDGKNIRNVQTTRVAKDGTLVAVSISAAPIRSANGSVIGLSAIARDVRKQLRMMQALESQTAELKRSNDELTQFAYVASHDLQEPLRMVASYTELLASRYQGQLDDRADKYIAHISEGASRMQRLIRELLDYARVGTRAKEMAPVDLAAVTQDVLRDLERLVEGAQAEIAVSPLPMVLGDDVQLGQVLQNLIGNAIKFRADRPPRVTVRAQREGRMWRVTVADNGIGIDMRFHDRVFEIFRRLHDRDAYDGTGVGLAVVKRIVERHGGRVWFESTPGEGTSFHFTVPAADDVKDL